MTGYIVFEVAFDFQVVLGRRGRSILNWGGLLCPEVRPMISELAMVDLLALEASGLLPQRPPGGRSTNQRRAIGV